MSRPLRARVRATRDGLTWWVCVAVLSADVLLRIVLPLWLRDVRGRLFSRS